MLALAVFAGYLVGHFQYHVLVGHTLYWTMTSKQPIEEHINVLRTAVNLLDE